MTKEWLQQCRCGVLLQGQIECIRMCEIGNPSLYPMYLLFFQNSIIWPLLLGCPRISPKLKKNLFLFLSLPDKPPHFTPVQPPDGKSTVFSLFRSPSLTSGVLGFFPVNNDLGQQIPVFEVGSRLCQIRLLGSCIFFSPSTFLPLLVWRARGQVYSGGSFDVRRIF